MIPLFKVLMNPDQSVLLQTLQSGYVAQGPRVEEFERRLKEYFKTEFVLATNSATSAIDLALHLYGVGPGDEVITPTLNCTAGTGVIVRRGARPIWADIDSRTGCASPSDVARKITPRTKAIMCVDWAGQPCNYEELFAIHVESGIPIIRDAAHTFAPLELDYMTDCTINSYQAIKFLSNSDGGSIKVPPSQYRRAKLLRWYGLDRESNKSFRCEQDIKETGYKYHMNDVTASIGLANFDLAIVAIKKARLNARKYYDDLGSLHGIQIPPWNNDACWWFYPLLILNGKVKEFQEFMRGRGIETSPVHTRNDRHSAFNFPCGPLPNTDFYTERHVGIPTGWWLSDTEVYLIIQAIRDWDRQ